MELNKRILRDLKSNFFRYFAVFCVVAIAMYVVVGMAGAAETVMRGVDKHAKKNKVEDGQFTLFVPLSDNEKKELEKNCSAIEEHFNIDFSVKETTLRVFKVRQKIDLIELDEGKLPSKDNEIVLEKHYYEANSYHIGDIIKVGDLDYIVVGYGSSPDYDDVLQSLADASSKPTRFGTSFVSEEGYNKLLESENALNTEEVLYAYILADDAKEDELVDSLQKLEFNISNVKDKYALDYFSKFENVKTEFSDGINDLVSGSDKIVNSCNDLKAASDDLSEKIISFGKAVPQLKDGSDALNDGTESLKNASDKLKNSSIDLNEGVKYFKSSYEKFSDEYLIFTYLNLKQHVNAESNARINASAGDIEINKTGALIAGAIVLILLAYVLSAFAINNIEQERKIIGTLYSIGFKKRELLVHYIILPVIICTFGGVLGTILGFVNMNSQIAENSVYFSYPILDNEYPLYLIIYGIVVPFFMSLIVNVFLINKKLSQKPLELMRKQQSSYSGKELTLGKMSFINKFRVKLFIREIKTNLTISAGMFISLLLVMLAVTIYSATTTIVKETDRDINFNYMYYLAYPEDNAPDNAEKAYLEKFSKDRLNYSFDVSVLGISKDSKAFPFNIKTSNKEVYISTSVAEKYDLKTGDTIDLTDKVKNLTYNFEIKEVVDYAPGLFVFMDIDSMREKFNQKNDYYNVLLSDDKLDIENGRIYSNISAEDLRDASEIFWSLMKKLVYMLVIASVLLFVLVMYLMVKMIIERQTNNISMFKLFGYSKSEISKLYLRNNLYIVIISAAIFIPLTKWIIVKIYPFLTANRSVGFNLTFSKEIYLFLIGVILVSYALAYVLSVLRLNRIDDQEILKERE